LQLVELTLNLLCFSRHDPSKFSNKEVNGFYDFNKTPIALIGTKSLIYDNPTINASWAPPRFDAFYVSPAPKHFWCLCFFMPIAHCCCVADTWQLYPSHCAIPTISTADLVVLVACNLLHTLQSTIPTTTIKATNRSTAIRNLCNIINLTLPFSATAPRVGAALEPWVPPATITPLPDMRVLHSTVSNSAPTALYPQNTTTSMNATSHARICTTQFVHQWVTHNNNPFAPLADEEPDDPADQTSTNCSPDNVTIAASNHVPSRSQLLSQPITH
jgi:hypothetical protein